MDFAGESTGPGRHAAGAAQAQRVGAAAGFDPHSSVNSARGLSCTLTSMLDGGTVHLLEHWLHQPKWRGWKNFNRILFLVLDEIFFIYNLGMYYVSLNIIPPSL